MKHVKFIFLICFLFHIVLFSSVYGESFPLKEISSVGIGYPKAVEVIGNEAYLVCEKTFAILDISDKSNPVMKGRIYLEGSAKDLSITGDYAYLNCGTHGLAIINITNPDNPSIVSTYPVESLKPGLDVDSNGDYVYFLVTNLLEIINVTDPENPEKVGECLTYADRLQYHDGLVYVTSDSSSENDFYFIDVSSPANPISYPDDGINKVNATESFYIENNYAYVQTYNGLWTINITNPFSMTEESNIELTSGTNETDIFVLNDIAYYLTDTGGLFFIDVTDKSNPSLIGNISTPGTGSGVFVLGSYGYVADSQGGLRIINISDLNNPVEEGNFWKILSYPYQCIKQGDYLYIASDNNTLTIVDISNINSPEIITRKFFDEDVRRLDVSGNYLYLTLSDSWSSLYVVDISDKYNPTKVYDFETNFSGRDVKVRNNNLYLTQEGLLESFNIYNVQDPENPEIIWNYSGQPLINPDKMVFTDYAVYLNDYDYGLVGFNLSIPTQPELIYYHKKYTWSTDVAINDDYLYLLYDYKVIIFNISGEYPEELFSLYLPTDSAISINVYKNYLLVGANNNSIYVYDVRDYTNPQLIDIYNTIGPPISMLIENNYLYLGERRSRLHILSFPELYLLSGSVIDQYGDPVTNLEMQISGDLSMAVITDNNGYYEIENIIEGSNLTIQPIDEKNDYEFYPETIQVNNINQDQKVDFNAVKIFRDTLENLVVYPNPWKSVTDEEKVIFKNLTRNCKIEVFSISGERVFEVNTKENQYVWDLNNKGNRKIASGIYLYVVSNDSGEEKRGKLAIIK